MSYKNDCKYLTTIIFLFIYGFCYSQKEINIWYFGNSAGIDFNQNPPAPLINSNMKAVNGTSVMSDENGNLLFYSNGHKVWNRNHQVMSHGTLSVDTVVVANQSVLIVPKPLSSTIYYIFVVSSVNSSYINLTYNIIDLSLDNGYGDVTVMNQILYYQVAFALTGIGTNDCNGIWVINLDEHSNFLSFKVDSSGLNTTPVITTIGYSVSEQDAYIKPTLDGKKIASTHQHGIDLFDFNFSAGTVSNKVTLTDIYSPRTVEFSPDNSKIYTITEPYPLEILHQYDISSGVSSTIMNSHTIVDTINCWGSSGDLYLGPDKKVYCGILTCSDSIHLISNQNYLGVINYPNASGTACNYNPAYFNLGSGQYISYLSNFVRNYYNNKPQLNFQDLCVKDTVHFTADTIAGINSYSWNFGDTNSLNNYSSLKNPSHYYGKTGIYKITLSANECMVTDSITISDPILVNLGNDTSICDGTSLKLDAKNYPAIYSWSTGNTTEIITVSKAQRYKVQVLNSCNEGVDSIDVGIIPYLEKPLSKDTTACTSSSIDLRAGSASAKYYWNTNDTTETISVDQSGKYWVTISNRCFNKTDSININIINPRVDLTGENIITPNNDGKNDEFILLKETSNLNDFHLEIYNRWGSLVYVTDSSDSYWQAKNISDGIYYYSVRIKNCKNETVDNKGIITVLR